MEPNAREADADLITVVWAWADGLVTDDEARGAVILHRQARLKQAGVSPTPTPHRSPERIGLERGAVGVSLADRRACWTCQWADGEEDCLKPYAPEIANWCLSNVTTDNILLPTARDCPGYEDKA